jgi:hypothetical protein
VEKIKTKRAFVRLLSKANKDIYERRLYRHLVQVGDNEVRKLRYRIKETNKFKAMINIKENAVICLGYLITLPLRILQA